MSFGCAQAAAYYVNASTGSDSYTPSQAQNSSTPWLTVQHAAAYSGLAPGDTVYIAPGTYASSSPIVLVASGSSTAPITFNGSGSATVIEAPFNLTNISYVTFNNFNVEQASVSQNSVDSFALVNCRSIDFYSINISYGHYGFNCLECDYCCIQGCSTYDTWTSGISFWGTGWSDGAGVPIGYPSGHNEINGDTGDAACNVGYNECIDLANGDTSSEIQHCVVKNSLGFNNPNGGEGIDVKLSAYGSNIHDNEVTGLQKNAVMLDGACYKNGATPAGLSHVSFYRNLIHDNASIGLVLEAEDQSGPGGPLSNIYVYNNLFYNNSSDGVYISNYDPNDGNGNTQYSAIWVCNNDSYQNGNIGISDYADPNGLDVHINNNICIDNGNWNIGEACGSAFNTLPAGNVTNNLVSEYYRRNNANNGGNKAGNVWSGDTGAQIFVDVASAPYNLQLNSPWSSNPAYGAGCASGIPNGGTSTDMNKNPRPAAHGYDIGAYEVQN